MAQEPRPSKKRRQLGSQTPRYRFFLNPYTDVRFTGCPQCGTKMRIRKLPLVIHLEPMQLAAMNKTCRYCSYCDLLIAHRDEVEASLATFFAGREPEVPVTAYLVVGTLDHVHWRRGMRTPLTTQEARGSLHDFVEVVNFKPVPRFVRRPTRAT